MKEAHPLCPAVGAAVAEPLEHERALIVMWRWVLGVVCRRVVPELHGDARRIFGIVFGVVGLNERVTRALSNEEWHAAKWHAAHEETVVKKGRWQHTCKHFWALVGMACVGGA
jgi:hypothetical protein